MKCRKCKILPSTYKIALDKILNKKICCKKPKFWQNT